MGLLSEIVLLPLAPVRAVGWTAQQVLDAARTERIAQLKRELAELEDALLTGEITNAEFEAREDELLDLLEEVDQWQA